MTKPAVMFPDVERRVVDYLDDALENVEFVDVASFVPTSWGVGSKPVILVVCDGAPRETWPIVAYPSVRIAAMVAPQAGEPVGSRTEAKRLALKAQGLMLSRTPDDDIQNVTDLTGLLTAQDPEHADAAVASTTVRVAIRTTPIT